MNIQNAKKSPIVFSISGDVWRSECERVAFKLIGELSISLCFKILNEIY